MSTYGRRPKQQRDPEEGSRGALLAGVVALGLVAVVVGLVIYSARTKLVVDKPEEKEKPPVRAAGPTPPPPEDPETVVRNALAAFAARPPKGATELANFVAPFDRSAFESRWKRFEAVRRDVEDVAQRVQAGIGPAQANEVRRLFDDPFAAPGAVVRIRDTEFRAGSLVLRTAKHGEKWYLSFGPDLADVSGSLYQLLVAIDVRGAPLQTALKVLREGVSAKAVTGENFREAMAQVTFLAAAGGR